MRDAPTQLDLDENTASWQQDAPRLEVAIDSNVNGTQKRNTPLLLNDPLAGASSRPSHAAQVAATREKCDTDDTPPDDLMAKRIDAGFAEQ